MGAMDVGDRGGPVAAMGRSYGGYGRAPWARWMLGDRGAVAAMGRSYGGARTMCGWRSLQGNAV